jgi:hypothetical protein
MDAGPADVKPQSEMHNEAIVAHVRKVAVPAASKPFVFVTATSQIDLRTSPTTLAAVRLTPSAH